MRMEQRLRRAGGRVRGALRERPQRRELSPPLRCAPGLPYPSRRCAPDRPRRARSGRRLLALRSGQSQRLLILRARGGSRARALRRWLRHGFGCQIGRPGCGQVQQAGRGLPKAGQPRAGRPVLRRRRHERAEAIQQLRRRRQRARQGVGITLCRIPWVGAAAACVAPACARPCASRPKPAAGMALHCCSCDEHMIVTLPTLTITIPCHMLMIVPGTCKAQGGPRVRNRSRRQASEDAGRRGRAWRGGAVAQQQQRRGRQPQPARAPARPARREERPEPVLHVRPADAAWEPAHALSRRQGRVHACSHVERRVCPLLQPVNGLLRRMPRARVRRAARWRGVRSP